MIFTYTELRELKKIDDYLNYKIAVLEHSSDKTLGDLDLLNNLKLIKKYILKIVR